MRVPKRKLCHMDKKKLHGFKIISFIILFCFILFKVKEMEVVIKIMIFIAQFLFLFFLPHSFIRLFNCLFLYLHASHRCVLLCRRPLINTNFVLKLYFLGDGDLPSNYDSYMVDSACVLH